MSEHSSSEIERQTAKVKSAFKAGLRYGISPKYEHLKSDEEAWELWQKEINLTGEHQ